MSSIFRRFFNSLILVAFIPTVLIISLLFYFRIITKKEIVSNYQKITDLFAVISYDNINNFARRLEYFNYLRKIYTRDESFFSAVKEKYPEIVFVAILDNNGLEIKRASFSKIAKSFPILDISKEPYFKRLSSFKEGVIGNFTIRGGLPLATVVYPVDNNYIYTVVNLKDFFLNIYLTRIGNSGFIFYISDDGKLLSDLNFKLSFDVLSKIISQEYGSIVSNIGNEKYLIVFRKVGDFEFYVAVAQSYKEVFRNLNVLFYFVLFVLLLVLNFSYFYSYFLTKKFTDPISSVIDQSYKVANGNFDVKVNDKTDIKEINTLIDVFNMMVSKLKEYENIQIEKIMDEREKLNMILQNIPVAVILTDLSGNPIYMNPFSLRNFKEKDRSFFHNLINRASENKTKVFEENSRYYEFIYEIVKLQRQLPMLLFVIEDITFEMNLYKTKEEVFRSIVHDIRTPLLNMQGYIKLLSYDTNEKTKKYIEGLENESSLVFRMLENILDMARIENKSISLNLTKTEIVSFLEKISERFKARAEYKNINFQFVPKIQNIYLNIDEELFQRAIDNIVSNAFKYTPSGGSIELGVESLGNKRIRIFVKDTGRGIEEEKLKHIFEKFRSFSKDGFGLGLSITKTIIEMHNGSIEIKSKEGKGTDVYIYLEEAS